jgi:acyl-CoA thioester hydrolase
MLFWRVRLEFAYYNRAMDEKPGSETKSSKGKLLHSLAMPVRWGDMDALGHVNNILYLQYFEQSRIAWSESLGYGLDQRSEGMILLKSSITYLKPVTYPANIEIRLYAGRLGRTSFALVNELRVEGKGDELWTEGEFLIVWFDYRAGKAAPIPTKLRVVLA